MQADQPVSAASRERYVRRRMRLMLRQQERLHQCRMVSVRRSSWHERIGLSAWAALMCISIMQVTWLGAIVPSAPLAFLPIPNIPMYYAGTVICLIILLNADLLCAL